MKMKLMHCWLFSTLLFFTTNADVAKPEFSSETQAPLPAIWNNTSAQQRLKALRVARLNAYRALLERVYGFKIASNTNIYDCALESDKVQTHLNLLLKGATEMEKPQYTADGMVMVVYGIKLRKIIETIKEDKTFEALTITKSLEHQDKTIEALGCGALPDSKAMKMLLAKRAAELDAYRLMAERLTGVKINSDTTVGDMCLRNDKVQSSVVAFLKGLKPKAIKYGQDNSCAVTMQLKIREVVETVEKLVRIYNSGAKDKISKVNVATNDRIFSVTGHGAPRTELAAVSTPAVDLFHTERNILRRVIKQQIVVE